MVYEDFTTYILTLDTGADLTIAANKLTVTTMNRDEDTFIGKDYTLNHFDDFEHLIEARQTATVGSSALYCPIIVSKTLNGNTYFDAATFNDGIGFTIGHWGGNEPIRLWERELADDFDDYHAAHNTPYWFKFKRVGTVVTVKIYTDAWITQVDMLTIAATTDAMRYLWVGGRHHSSNGAHIWSGWVQNLDLQEIAAPTGSQIGRLRGVSHWG